MRPLLTKERFVAVVVDRKGASSGVSQRAGKFPIDIITEIRRIYFDVKTLALLHGCKSIRLVCWSVWFLSFDTRFWYW